TRHVRQGQRPPRSAGIGVEGNYLTRLPQILRPPFSDCFIVVREADKMYLGWSLSSRIGTTPIGSDCKRHRVVADFPSTRTCPPLRRTRYAALAPWWECRVSRGQSESKSIRIAPSCPIRIETSPSPVRAVS